MDHEERKSMQLPCGFTVAESWAALRKSWLGFKIARSNSDTALMTKYASIIRKVQLEMGIRKTKFDSNILEDQDLEFMGAEDEEGEIRDADEANLDENASNDYDGMMYEARQHLKRPQPAPRNELPIGSVDSSVEMRSPEEGPISSKNERRSCLYKPSQYLGRKSESYRPARVNRELNEGTEARIDIVDEELENNEENGFQWEERVRRSCIYPMKQEKDHQWIESVRRSCIYPMNQIPSEVQEQDQNEQTETDEGAYYNGDDSDYSNVGSNWEDIHSETENRYVSEDDSEQDDLPDNGQPSHRRSCRYERKGRS